MDKSGVTEGDIKIQDVTMEKNKKLRQERKLNVRGLYHVQQLWRDGL